MTQMKERHVHNRYPAYTNIKRHSKSFLHYETQVHYQVSKQRRQEIEFTEFIVKYKGLL